MGQGINENPKAQVILETDGEVILYKDFFNLDERDRLFQALYSEIIWQQETIQLFGKKYQVPRLIAWYGDRDKVYTYSGIAHTPQAWNSTLFLIKNRLETLLRAKFNSVLLNLYRDGQDSMAWHSDDEPELGKNPTIASVSFGATRRFSLKHKHIKERKVELELSSGSLLLMQGETQHYWKHQIPKTKKPVGARINLTFRTIQ
ncbi:alpha-ketoglutarate-dependent dioxygenase AlkB [Oscillatoria sp. FACHB-1406]|uniref:alpha-ketoglutarate-dependent dioxygenase AlkB family protein n=1 Tax=Oscillatoria sp. FACHB-1406 TaxID=2692846 RepID=UPI0016849F44|nr:alpha-ketoglutarate-dependent dioxygenase AlkB [Oscillatoria sp. FACHB-1406]MBD2579818.1 alpha-ketoglutarate-dependent dioxygenase AlkB [Oscillatoria sp. FACHB-1406]